MKQLNSNISFKHFFFSRKLPFGLIIALDENGNAEGSMYLDDGDQLLGKLTFFIFFYFFLSTQTL